MSRPPDPANPLASLRFDNRFTRMLPADPVTENSRRQVFNACYSRVVPVRPVAPQLVAYSPETAALIDLDAAACASPLFTRVFSGDLVLPGMDPHAACYGGHQFGNWAGQLGDGRAINLGETVNRRGEHWTLQLKGAGPTPYSRRADGLAVMRSSLREFLCSEAMHHLGVPTTRALSLILTGERVERDMFYDGRVEEEPGAVVCRVAPSFLRFGNYELFAARGELEVLRRLADFTIRTLFPHLGEPSPAVYGQWFAEVCRTTAELMVHWLRVGFVHGVMNTDNLSILGLTIDYGPYGWLEDYDPYWTPNTTDAAGRRYCYGRQPTIAHWNLAQLANALHPLMGDPAPLEQALTDYSRRFEEGWQAAMAAKLGLKAFAADTDTALVQDMLGLLAEVETDMTLFYRHLAEIPAGTADDRPATETLAAPLMVALYRPDQATAAYLEHLGSWLDRYRARLRHDGLDDRERQQRMDAVNPKYVLRNYLAQLAIDDIAAGNFSLTRELLDVLRHPYDEQPGRERFAEKRPEWARHRPGCSMLSCSS
ncbi:protein adenylyltransferase SelO [uncultured Desulfobulbus sp.]|uniref:protein adenylyltransferase SelO n=1 Tax=uncultured Desulfobulbus sp. TaxID=239745 RepID=UPI002622B903|nr:YdiU family protein [uncultured Desulfobulbus sp.]